MSRFHKRQERLPAEPAETPRGFEAVIPNPNLKPMDQVREVMRLRHYSIRTEKTYGDWIRRYVKFHQIKGRVELLEGPEFQELHVLRTGGSGMKSPLDSL